ncbi:MAG: isocitrate/isopropylmalate family dehydrogenase [Acidimicrobiales bacterium]
MTLVPGDGIGPEVIGSAQRVLDAAGAPIHWEERHLGSGSDGDGDPLPSATLDSIRRNGVALKGPIATGTTGARSPNVGLRRALDMFVQMRPARSMPGAGSADVDLVVVRETTEDLYRGIEVSAGTREAEHLASWLVAEGLDDGLGPNTAFSIKPASARAVRRALEFTLTWMRREQRRRLTVVHKATVMRATDGIYLDVVADVAGSATDIEVDSCQIDGACAELVRHPQRFDVMFMPNMYGDIVSDVTAALTGGVGTAPGANHGDSVSVFEAVHGTAPLHAGRDEANPLAMIRSGVMLLEHLGERDVAHRIDVAIARLLAARSCLTYDLLGTTVGAAHTSEVTQELIDLL